MGMDYLDLAFHVQKQLGVKVDIRDVLWRRMGKNASEAELWQYQKEHGPFEITAGEYSDAVQESVNDHARRGGDAAEEDVWPEMQRIFAKVIGEEPGKVTRNSRLKEDLGYA